MGVRQGATNSKGLDDVSNVKLLESEFVDLTLEPMFKVFEAHIREGGLEPDSLRTDKEKLVRWNFRYEGKVSVCCGINIDAYGDVVNFLDMAVARITVKEKASAIMVKMNELNALVSIPVRYWVDYEVMTVKVTYLAENQYTSPEALENILGMAKNVSIGLLEILEHEFQVESYFNDDKEAA